MTQLEEELKRARGATWRGVIREPVVQLNEKLWEASGATWREVVRGTSSADKEGVRRGASGADKEGVIKDSVLWSHTFW